MTRTKICGITSVKDVLAVASAGADAFGMVFYEPSPRHVSIETAANISRQAGPFISSVALFVNPDPGYVTEVVERVKPHLLQFHGDENQAFCLQFGLPYIKAIRVRPDTDVALEAQAFSEASGLIFDAWSEDLYGGTGQTFDWEKISGFEGPAVILAGGLKPENVAEAIRLTKPYGVDVSGGVEVSPGIKDRDKIERFIKAVK